MRASWTSVLSALRAAGGTLSREEGVLLPHLDLLIAATALAHDLTLLTRNRRHFERLPALTLYEAE